MSSEREVKLAAPAAFRLPDLSGLGDGLESSPEEPVRYRTVYVDTPDLRIARWGGSLRHREGQGWTVKLPPQRQDGTVLVRGEYLFPGDVRRVPNEAVDLLRAYIRGSRLQAVARLRTVRTRVGLTDVEGGPVGEVVDDEVSVMEGSRVAARFRELEIELREDAPASLFDAVLKRLREAGAGPVSTTPKYLRALGPRASEPPEVVVPEIGADATVGEVIRGAIASSVVRLLRNDAGVRLGEDPEAVHQARVATRRLRSDLRTFRAFLDPEWNTGLREELGWLGGELGAVRDADVLLARLRSREQLLPEGDRVEAEALFGRLETSRAEARAVLLEGMRSPRYAEILERLIAAALEPSLAGARIEARAREVLGAVVDGPWSHLRKQIRELGPDAPDEALHAARIRAKRVRYAAEAVAPVFGKRAREFAHAAVGLQDVLGEHQDAVVAAAWLREEARSGRGRSFIAGELAMLESEAAHRAREAWPGVWKALSRKRLRFWT